MKLAIAFLFIAVIHTYITRADPPVATANPRYWPIGHAFAAVSNSDPGVPVQVGHIGQDPL